MRNREELVWLPDEEVTGKIVGGLGAFVTRVVYTKGGIEYDVLLERDEFLLMEDFFEYDDE